MLDPVNHVRVLGILTGTMPWAYRAVVTCSVSGTCDT